MAKYNPSSNNVKSIIFPLLFILLLFPPGSYVHAYDPDDFRYYSRDRFNHLNKHTFFDLERAKMIYTTYTAEQMGPLIDELLYGEEGFADWYNKMRKQPGLYWDSVSDDPEKRARYEYFADIYNIVRLWKRADTVESTNEKRKKWGESLLDYCITRNPRDRIFDPANCPAVPDWPFPGREHWFFTFR